MKAEFSEPTDLQIARRLAKRLERVLIETSKTEQIRVRLPHDLIDLLPYTARERNAVITTVLAAGLTGVDLKQVLIVRSDLRRLENMLRQGLVLEPTPRLDWAAVSQLIDVWRTLSL